MSTICCIKNVLLHRPVMPLPSTPMLASYQCTRGLRKKDRRYLVWPNDWLPFHWEKPEPTVAPHLFATGDPVQRIKETVNLEEYQDGFEFLKERTDVPESVKNLFKLKHADRWVTANRLREKREKLFRRHPHDEVSPEAKVARYTSIIRSFVEIVKDIAPNDTRSKQVIVRNSHWRDKYLQMLWRIDRERYEILKRELNIDHKPGLPGEVRNPLIFRKPTLRKLTIDYCDKLRKDKMDEYHAELKAKQEEFKKEKEETLKWIENQMKKYHIKENDVSGEYKSQHDPRPVHTPPPKIPPPLEHVE